MYLGRSQVFSGRETDRTVSACTLGLFLIYMLAHDCQVSIAFKQCISLAFLTCQCMQPSYVCYS